MIHVYKLFLQLKKLSSSFRIKGRLPNITLEFIISFLFLLFNFILAYSLIFKNRVYPNVFIANHNLGGKTPEQSQIKLQTFIRNIPSEIQLKSEQQAWELNLQSLGIAYDIEASVYQAYSIGRNRAGYQNLIKRWQLIYQPHHLSPVIIFDHKAWETTSATISAQIDQPIIPPTIKIIGQNQNRQIQITDSQPGRRLDTKSLTETLHQQLADLNFQSIPLPIIPLLPTVTQEQTEATKQRAERLLNKTIILKSEEQSWTLNDESLINFLDFSNGLNEDKIASWAGQLANSIDRPPQNALFRFENGRVSEFKPGLNGLELDQTQTSNQIIQAIQKLENEADQKTTISLPINFQKPKVSTSEVNDLGIKELIGQGKSWFRGSISSRIHNIKLGSQKINGTLIAPGEIFSFNQTIGEIDQSSGFQPAYIIKEGRTILGDGGGVCQISTTLFRAALNAGLPIEERRAHAYRVSYYEQNSAVGLDATVFAPTTDFKFKNDTPGHILIQTIFNPSELSLTFELYGTADGRQAIISSTRLWDQVPPPPDLYQDDPNLPANTVKQIDWKAWGAKTAFDWKVTRGNEVLQERTFYSNYQPWQAVFLRGTGGT